MIKPLVFLPCERVIVSQDENTSSLIVVLETVNIPIPINAEVPANALVPFRWTIYALWRFEPETEGVGAQFEQRTVLVSTDGQLYFENTLPFTVAADVRNHRTTVLVPGFPLLAAGNALLKLAVREVREGVEFREAAEFPIRINRIQ